MNPISYYNHLIQGLRIFLHDDVKRIFSFCRHILLEITDITDNQRSIFRNFQCEFPIQICYHPIGTDSFFHDIRTNNRFARSILHHSGYFFLSGTGLLARFFFNKINLIVFYFKSYLRSCQQFRQCFIQTGIFHLNRNFAIHIDQLIAEYQPHSCLCFYRRQYFFYLLIIKIQRNFL